MARRRPRMSVKTAAWIRANAWRRSHSLVFTETPKLYTACACELGPCGYCTTGRHAECTHEHHEPAVAAAGYLVNQRGEALATVYEAGHHHVWTCTCKATDHDGMPVQATLF
jgi:hypothetical protein